MARWRVTLQWDGEFEAEDEGAALLAADMEFSFMREAYAEEIDEEAEAKRRQEEDDCDIPW